MQDVEKFAEVDKSITRDFMGAFKDKVVPIICPMCHGKEPTKDSCDQCEGEGSYEMQY